MSLDVPDWLKDHPDLRARDIVLHRALDPYKSIYYTDRHYDSLIPQYVVKVLDPAKEECEINERLQVNLPSPNHGLPCEIIRSEPRLLVMPLVGGLNSIIYMNRPTSFILDVYHQIIEGIEHLHRLRIVHLDICFENIASASEYQASTDGRLVAGKVYLIDFGQSRQLALGPGCQPPIVLPASQEDKPLELSTFDPFSFDVYCVGKVMQSMLLYTALPESEFPWIPVRYARWVVGEERGCTSVCRCRPTARRARQVLTVLRWFVYTWEFLGTGFAFVRRVLTTALTGNR